jgi:hypothetical protein
VHSEQGPELAYYLAKNPAFEAALRQMPESSVAYELGSLAYRLKTEREAVAKAAAKVSQAPPPVQKIDGSGEAGARVDPSSPDSDSLSDDEWKRRRERQLEKRKSR